MAQITINTSDFVADGTSLAVYTRSAWGVESTAGAPSGSSVTTATTSAGHATFSGLTEGVTYLAYDSGSTRKRQFSVPVSGTSGTGTLAARPAATSVVVGYVYFATDDNGGTAYRSDGSAWSKMGAGALETGGRRLNYSAAASTFSQVAAVQNTDYTLIDTFTVTVGARPIMLRGVCPSLTFSVAGSNLALRLYEGATQLQSASWGSPATAGRGFAGFVEVLLSPSAGDHTYKMTVRASNAAGDISSISGATAPMYLVAVEQ